VPSSQLKARAPLALNATAASLLGFLNAGPQSGYELAARIEHSIGPFWNVTRSQIYRELRVLESAGCVTVGETGSRDRRPYALTDAGRLAFADWIAREPGDENIRFPLLLTLFFGGAVPPAQLARTLRDHRARHAARLAGYRAILPALEREQPFPARAARFGIIYEEAVLAWFATLAADGLLSEE
jgi:DNA-binding PadR family transcriptional regulator